MAVPGVTCIAINHGVFVKCFSSPHIQMDSHLHNTSAWAHMEKKKKIPIFHSDFLSSLKLACTISTSITALSFTFLGHKNQIEYFQSRISVLKHIEISHWCFSKSYKHCILIRRQFQFSQENSNLKEVSHFVLWHEKKNLLMIPIKNLECHFYIFVLFQVSKSRAQNKVIRTLLKLEDFL